MSQNTENNTPEKKNLWNFIDNVKGDKVVWIIVLLLIMISALAIFSSTSTLTGEDRDRVDLLRKHSYLIVGGLGVIWLLNKIKGRFFRDEGNKFEQLLFQSLIKGTGIEPHNELIGAAQRKKLLIHGEEIDKDLIGRFFRG